MLPTSPSAARGRRDRCPGVLRPWQADDGSLVRIRLIGGEVSAAALRGLAEIASTFGDGNLHLTSRANLQLRAVDHGEPFVRAVERLGLLPSRRHDRARNVLVSPLTGRLGGRLDARPLAADLDRLIRADERLADLPGRFLFTLDDGRGDLIRRPTDLGFMALGPEMVQLRVGRSWGEVIEAGRAVPALGVLAHAFLDARGPGADAPWHVAELLRPLTAPRRPDQRTHVEPEAHALGAALVRVPDAVLTPGLVADVTARGGALVVTPWRSIVVTELLP